MDVGAENLAHFNVLSSICLIALRKNFERLGSLHAKIHSGYDILQINATNIAVFMFGMKTRVNTLALNEINNRIF
jgi:hypothetical protein